MAFNLSTVCYLLLDAVKIHVASAPGGSEDGMLRNVKRRHQLRALQTTLRMKRLALLRTF